MKDDVKVSMVIIFVITILILSIIPLTVHSDPEPEPFLYEFVDVPDNSFGIGDHWVKTVNWPFFLQYIHWSLEYKRYSYSSWTDGNQYLTIEKEFNESLNGWKFNLILDVPVSVYSARFTCSVNLNVLDYIERDGWSVNLSYFNESFFFDWSDMASIPDIEFSKGILDNRFWFRFGRYGENGNSIPKGIYEFDPFFGNVDTLASNYIYNNGLEYYRGVWAIMGADDGEADNITIQTGTIGYTADYECAIYEYVDYSSNYAGDLVGVTDTVEIDDTEDYDWVVFPFSSKPCLVKDTKYYLVIRIKDDLTGGSSNSVYLHNVTSGFAIRDTKSGGVVFDDPLTSEDVTNENPTIYCSYTIPCSGAGWSDTCPVSSNPSIANKSVDVSVDVGFWNVTIEDQDGNNTNGSIESSNGDIVYWDNQPNGTRSLTLSTLVCETNYTIYLNFTSETNVSCITNETYWFITDGCPFIDTCPVSSNPSISNKSTDVSIDVGFWNVTITDADGNNTNGSIECNNGNIVWWDNQANGTRSLTLSTLLCETNYTIYLNFTSETNVSCIINESYWFVTEDCGYVDTCPVSSNPTILNGSCCNELTLSWNITITDADGNNTNGSIECNNGNIVWWDNQVNGTRSLSIVNLTCGSNYTVYLNFTSETNVSCIINETYWFITINCTGLCDCDDFYNETELGIYLSENGYIKESDEVDINIGLDGTLLTLVLFAVFFIVGYIINKRSGGILMIFSGFTLLSFEYLVSSASVLNAILVIPLLSPIAILIIVLGVRKWLYPVEGEKTKSEGT